MAYKLFYPILQNQETTLRNNRLVFLFAYDILWKRGESYCFKICWKQTEMSSKNSIYKPIR